jgi:hypothetical protein
MTFTKGGWGPHMKHLLPLLPPGPGGFTNIPLQTHSHKQSIPKDGSNSSGGEGGIRTLGSFLHTLSKREP